MNFERPARWRTTALATAAAAACLAGLSTPVHALSLGRASVQSTLGEAIRAEVEFEALNAEEAETLRASVATAETYRLSGVDFNQALVGARVVLQRIAGRRPTLRITTDRVVQEPFVDLVLELNWRGGRLVRSYTLLLDLPPSTRGATNPAQITSPAMTAPTPSAFPSGLTAGARAPSAAPRPAADRNRRGPPPVGSPPAPASVPDPYRVRPGDTLSEVAQRGERPAGVSLDRLVVAMYRDNPGAFVDGNINRLRHGMVLQAASQRSIDAVSDAEARRVIRARSSDFNAYRDQVAARPVERAEPADGRRASGRVEAAVEDRRQPAAPAPDRLTLSKPGVTAASKAEAASRESERREAAAREAELARNVRDLGRLSGTVGAASAGASAAAGPGGATASVPGIVLPVPAPVVPGASSPAAGPGATGPGATASGSVPADVSPAPVVASSPASAASVSPTASAPRPRPPLPPVVPPEQPGFMDSLLEDNLPAVGLAAALVVLLGAFVVFKMLRRRRDQPPETSFLDSHLKPDSFFGASGGQRVDTREAAPTAGPANSSSMMNYSLSQLDAIGDVDPVAEADVYLAYGRDLQAEEILKEALRTTPERLAIRSKLLEIYAKRRDVKGFEEQAQQLHAATGGQGDDWAKAAELGRQLDPENTLYGGSGPVSRPPREMDDAIAGAPTMPQSILPSARDSELPREAAPSSSFDLDLDLDLSMDDIGNQTTMPIDTDATVIAPATPQPGPVMPPAAPVPPPPAPAPYVPAAEDMVNFVTPTGFGPPDGLPPAPPPPAPRAAPVAAPLPAPPPPAGPSSFNASSFSLDLDLPEPSALSAGPSMLPPIEGFDAAHGAVDVPLDDGDPLVRKLELADEFRQIGDLEGARDLLQEVVDRADGALKAKAQAMLTSLM